MGAWGSGSFQNDTAMDFISELLNVKALKKLVTKKADHYTYDELRVSAEILIHLHKLNPIWVEQEIIDDLILGLKSCIKDKSWLDSWCYKKDADDIVKKIKGFIRKLEDLHGY